MTVPTYTKSGNKAQALAALDKKVFGVEVKNHELLNDAYSGYLANGRLSLARTKKRGEVRGGGRKPIRQKGTGNARVGSIRTPIWRGGGIIFGPTGEENYSKKLSRKAKRKALSQSLTLAARADKIIVVEDFMVASGKTADAARLLSKIDASGRVLLVVENKTSELQRPVKNLARFKMAQPEYLSVFDIINADKIIITKNALGLLSEILGGNK